MEDLHDDVQYMYTFQRFRGCRTKSPTDQKQSSSSKIEFTTPNWQAPSRNQYSESVSPLTKSAINPFPKEISGGGYTSQSSSLDSEIIKSPASRKRSQSIVSSTSPTSKRSRTQNSPCQGTSNRPIVIDSEPNRSEILSASPNESIVMGSEDVGLNIEEAKDDFIDLHSIEDFKTPQDDTADLSLLRILIDLTQPEVLVGNDVRQELSYYQHHSLRLSVGRTVELKGGDFLKINRISQTSNGAVLVEGLRFRRTRELKGILEKKLNEVCWIIERIESETAGKFLETKQEVDVNEIKCFREIRFTNLPYPEGSLREETKYYEVRESALHIRDDAEDTAPLVCRWKMTITPTLQNERRSSTWKEQILRRLVPAECDPGMSIEQGHLRQQFRGETIIGGSSLERPSEESFGHNEKNSEEVFVVNRLRNLSVYEIDCTVFKSSTIPLSSLDSDFEEIRLNPPSALQNHRFSSTSSVQVSSRDSIDRMGKQQKYTFGDAFCGCGGTSRGALMAKLQINWGFDFSPRAIEAYHSNFDKAESIEMTAHDFIQICSNESLRDWYKVDILHISPPCQPFSPAHTVDGKDDERNRASLFAINGLLEKIRPRVVTVEQTFGLVSRHPDWFRSVVLMFTSHDYSIRWKIINCKDYGVPQARQRLVVIGACPGEALPPFPEPTHGPLSVTDSHSKQFRPYTTVGDQIRYIPKDCPAHGPKKYFNTPKTPYDKNTVMSKTITCSGGIGNYHPDGLRAFTPREFACLQTFPLSHTFSHVGTIKQIGNAVPPLLAKTLFKSIVKSLRKADGLE